MIAGWPVVLSAGGGWCRARRCWRLAGPGGGSVARWGAVRPVGLVAAEWGRVGRRVTSSCPAGTLRLAYRPRLYSLGRQRARIAPHAVRAPSGHLPMSASQHPPLSPEEERVWRRFVFETEFYARNCAKIVTKGSELEAVRPRPAQLVLEAALEKQRLAGRPERAIVLKSRQTGISTWVQIKMMQRASLRANRRALVVAQDNDTAASLFDIGKQVYQHLPPDVDLRLKPEMKNFRDSDDVRLIHFGTKARGARNIGDVGVNSWLRIDTAKEADAGRGKTFTDLHLSEMAFWANQGKALSLLNAVPDLPGTLIVIESTANGTNEFRKRWDRAYAGDGDYAPVFISWLIDPDCWRAFGSMEDRADFEAQIGDGPYGADEPGLVELGASAEQLHWRRTAIVDKCDGDVAKFKQEYPSHPGEAFLGSGNHVFSFSYIERVLRRVEATDPPRGVPGVLPLLGDGLFLPAAVTSKSVRDGTVEVPVGTVWVPREVTGFDDRKDWWRVWEHPFTARMAESASTTAEPVQAGQYVVACDVAGGDEMTSGEKSAWHAIQVVNHHTLEQCAEWRSRCDPDLLPLELFLVASYFNEAVVVVETTGSWGGPVVTALHRRLGYRQIYRRQVKGTREERPQDMLGWDTNRRTKPYLETAFREQLREGTDGIRSRGTGLELSTYVRDARGNSGPDDDCFSDRLMAYMIAQYVAHERRPRPPKKKREPGAGWTPRNPVTGY